MLVKIYVWPDGTRAYQSAGISVVGVGESMEQAQEGLAAKLDAHISLARTAAEKSALKAQRLEELKVSLDK